MPNDDVSILLRSSIGLPLASETSSRFFPFATTKELGVIRTCNQSNAGRNLRRHLFGLPEDVLLSSGRITASTPMCSNSPRSTADTRSFACARVSSMLIFILFKSTDNYRADFSDEVDNRSKDTCLQVLWRFGDTIFKDYRYQNSLLTWE